MNRDDEGQEAHFQHCIDLWQRWMNATDSHRLGHRNKDSVCGWGLSNYMASEDDRDVIYELADSQLAKIVNACVESLIPHERHAVLMAYGFSRVWPFAALVREEAHAIGMLTLRRLVSKRC